MQRFTQIVFLCAALSASLPVAHAKKLDPAGFDENYEPEPVCNATGSEHLERMKKLMDKIDTVLPNVPPEEDKYLSAESKAISVKGGKSRIERLHARPMYDLWQARNALRRAEKSLAAIQTSTNKPTYSAPAAQALHGAIEATLPVQGFSADMKEFLMKDQDSKNSHVENKDFLDTFVAGMRIAGLHQEYMACMLRQVARPLR